MFKRALSWCIFLSCAMGSLSAYAQDGSNCREVNGWRVCSTSTSTSSSSSSYSTTVNGIVTEHVTGSSITIVNGEVVNQDSYDETYQGYARPEREVYERPNPADDFVSHWRKTHKRVGDNGKRNKGNGSKWRRTSGNRNGHRYWNSNERSNNWNQNGRTGNRNRNDRKNWNDLRDNWDHLSDISRGENRDQNAVNQGNTYNPSVNTQTEPTSAYVPASNASYYALLSSSEQAIYNAIYENSKNRKATSTFNGNIDKPTLSRVVDAVVNDHPEIIWIYEHYTTERSSVNGVVTETTVTMSFNGLEDEQYFAAFKAEADRILANARQYSTQKDREKYIHDYLVQNVEYVKSDDLDQSAYSALVMRRTVCAGYAAAFKYLMDQLSIPTYIVSGQLADDDGNLGNHAWNIVNLNGRYYNVDVTSDYMIRNGVRETDYRLFNKSDDEFEGMGYIRLSEYVDYAVVLPECR